ncbi:MAG: glycosyl transferase [Desulfuromonas sp.]|nr:glycosyl transferase [Desulfuromonas sp.]
MHELAHRGFRRTALAYKDNNGTLHLKNPFRGYQILAAILATMTGALVGLLGGQLFNSGINPQQPLWGFLLPALVGATIGLICGISLLPRSRYGISRDELLQHARLLTSQEAVLLLRAPVHKLTLPFNLLSGHGENHPTFFVIHPVREKRKTVRSSGTLLTQAQLRKHAVKLAREQQVSAPSSRNTALICRLKGARLWIQQVCKDLLSASLLEQATTPVAEWILDNEYIIEGNSRDVLLNMPDRFYRQLPILDNTPYHHLPSCYGLAKELVFHTELRLDQENIIAFIEAYQTLRPLSIGELWAIPQMLRIALIESVQNLAVTTLSDLRERQLAAFWSNRLITTNRRDPDQLFPVLAELTTSTPAPSPYFGVQLISYLHDETAALVPVQQWLERTLDTPLHDITLKKQNRLTKEQLESANAFGSLRQLDLLDWRELFEQLSCVENVLAKDPAQIYAKMDFATRDRCRNTTETLARCSGRSEVEVAQQAIEIATTAAGNADDEEHLNHVGSYLIGDKKQQLRQQLQCRDKLQSHIREWIFKQSSWVYFFALIILTTAIISLGFAPFSTQTSTLGEIAAFSLLLFPTSQLALEIVNYLITRILPPHSLPKMDFEHSGIPSQFKTLVVVPMMLGNEQTIDEELEKLEIRYLANKEKNLLFSLFSDYTDDDEPQISDDQLLLPRIRDGITALNQRYNEERFFLFHRERRWSATEQKYIGWERKRGKLEELNHFLNGTRPAQAPPLVYVGDPNHLTQIRFVITLDSDTQLPHGTARRMVETLAHPLNQPRFDSNGQIIAGTYTIIQPRMNPTLSSTSATLFSRLFADAVGIDPYTQAVSDVYQDLRGEGTYHGKGIYDVRAFTRILGSNFPEDRILSHDLIEGAHVRVGLASDIVLYDDFPHSYQSYTRRAHRWIRGDWQIIDWLLPWVPLSNDQKGPNPLCRFDRWKIFDNLRRSLLPIANLTLLLLSWSLSATLGWIVSTLVACQLLFHPIAHHLTLATTRKGLRNFNGGKLLHDIVRALVEAVLLPHQAALNGNAIVKVGYRRLISKRHLLEWTPQSTLWHQSHRQSLFILTLATVSLFSLITGYAVLSFSPGTIHIAIPWLGLWLFCPLVGWLLSLQPKTFHQAVITTKDRQFLRRITRRTWRYFSDFVTESTSWLPPDNYQVSHTNQLAMRTSPTNIGLWMASSMAAYDCGYQTPDQVIVSLTQTMNTLKRLERFRGHLLNWYDIETLKPLEPRYVSSVDSGNLLGTLVALEQGINEIVHAPLLDKKAFDGLYDTLQLQQEGSDSSTSEQLDQSLKMCETPPWQIADALYLLRALIDELSTQQMPSDMQTSTAPPPSAQSTWESQMVEQAAAWRSLADDYLHWIEILAEKSEEQLSELGLLTVHAIRHELTHPPTLHDLAHEKVATLSHLRALKPQLEQRQSPLHDWADRVIRSFDNAHKNARQTVTASEVLLDEIRALSDDINMAFLYDPVRKLFSVGYNVSVGQLDNSCYDLLASEARLGSFVSIARGDIPIEHWFSMRRPYGAIARKRVLLSWTGTMFEYLMPQLFQHSYQNSLLDKAARQTVQIQIDYAGKRRVPWGISESAYGDLDLNKTYQYKAFGVPELGLKRIIEEQLVVAPYATMMAINMAPQETLVNLRRLNSYGLLNDYGYYEAIDFSRRSHPDKEQGVIVKAYMAHHQGMAFLALTNFLHDNPFQRRFHADPRVRAFEPLLQERIPILPPLHYIATQKTTPAPLSLEQTVPTSSMFDTPHTDHPRTQLLCNGRYGVMITNAGSGYSKWHDYELTRWRADHTCDNGGISCFLFEPQSRQCWSPTYHPTGGKTTGYCAHFTSDRATFHRSFDGLHSEMEITVSPQDDVEIRRITLINSSDRIRTIVLTSYLELSMAQHSVDLQHPAFNKLFIETSALEEQRVLLARRRPRSDNDAELHVAHRITVTPGTTTPWQFETDRRRFIGRGNSLMNACGCNQPLSNSEGFVLDPVLCLREELTLEPGDRVQATLILAAGESKEQLLHLMEKYSEPHAIDWSMDFAWVAAQQQLRMLHIQPDEARRFQQLASHLLFPNNLLRASAKRLEENHKGQSGLWPYAISGDWPIALVTIREQRDIGLVIQLLQAHAYWRMHGLTADLVIINEEEESYDQPLQGQLEQLIQSRPIFSGSDNPGKIFLRNVSQIPEEDLRLFKAVARFFLVATRGTLTKQLGASSKKTLLPNPLIPSTNLRIPSTPLAELELKFNNGFGGFSRDGREYVITLESEFNTPAPWVNVMANPTFGTMVSERGTGFTWYGNSQRNRLTPWSNDPVIDPAAEAIYIRDEETGQFWTPTASPVREDTAYRCRHGAGYSIFEHNSQGINQSLTVFVPVDDRGGAPVKIQQLQLFNDSPHRRELSITYYVEWVLGENHETSNMHVITHWDNDAQALFARNRYHPDYGGRIAFAAISPDAATYCGDRTMFIGRNGSLAHPAAMTLQHLPKHTGAGIDPCAALQTSITLAPGENKVIVCMLGQCETVPQIHQLLHDYRSNNTVERTLNQTRQWWDNLLGKIEIHTPDEATDLLVNRWLPYQNLSCRIWGRSAFYQSGGAFGFRDQLQDAMALLYTAPHLAREQIVLAAGHQFEEGDVQHWWHPPSGAGIRSKISDDLLWLPYVVCQYIRVTGDLALLHETTPFLNAPALNNDQHEVFSVPETTFDYATLFEHCQRAVKHGLTQGPNGLPLIGSGDWNDGMNLVGSEGRGESVWLGWFLTAVLEGMAELARLMDQPQSASRYQQQRKQLIEQIEKHAWDGEWYRRGTFDDGTLLGSATSLEARIDSLPQSWAWLSGAATADRAEQALDAAWNHLVREAEGVILLFTPPFDKSTPSPGYIKGYPPGVRENGGQYTHAALWLAMAMAQKGDGNRAVRMLQTMTPIHHANDREEAERYRLEPYVIAADVYRLPGKIGMGGWSWYTGSAAWMYRAWIEEVLGLKRFPSHLQIDPVIPNDWSSFSVTYHHGETVYDMKIDNPSGVQHGIAWIKMNGQELDDGKIPLTTTLVKHTIRVCLGELTNSD